MSKEAAATLVAEVEARARTIYEQELDPIGRRFEFEAAPPPSETSGLPMVLFLGNHSSGKSSFINWLVGEELQRTGIAPIDDGFTIITHGGDDAVLDGSAVVTNPKFPWGDLERFGPQLLNHLKLRLRPTKALDGIALVDSPGMIDAADAKVTRGYNFTGVVRWFAERADVILLLFDPDKPGTTGETLSVLTESLSGLEHKLLIIFNKVDRFDTMRDYARAYGALCWNLSKAIPRKDLPHIFNTYLPTQEAGQHRGVPLEDFDKQREEVRQEVRRAPFRRVDNVISRLYQHARRMRMHVLVLDRLARDRRRLLLRYVGMALVVLLLGSFLTWAAWGITHRAPAADAPAVEAADGGSPWKLLAGTIGGTLLLLLGTGGLYAWDRHAKQRDLSLDDLFRRTFARELTLGDESEDLEALWATVKDRVRRALDARQGKTPVAWRAEVKRLDKVIDREVPELRAAASRR
jgi:GTPase SAR1 family protein